MRAGLFAPLNRMLASDRSEIGPIPSIILGPSRIASS
jgi:hypothetical protein